ncbi:transposase [Streptomyces glaucosporus]
MVGRLAPDALWELFQRVVPAAPVRPRGGGRRRYGDRQALAAVVFVATTGCTWRRLPPGFGPSGHRRLRLRHERRAEHVPAFTGIAATPIRHHRRGG